MFALLQYQVLRPLSFVNFKNKEPRRVNKQEEEVPRKKPINPGKGKQHPSS